MHQNWAPCYLHPVPCAGTKPCTATAKPCMLGSGLRYSCPAWCTQIGPCAVPTWIGPMPLLAGPTHPDQVPQCLTCQDQAHTTLYAWSSAWGHAVWAVGLLMGTEIVSREVIINTANTHGPEGGGVGKRGCSSKPLLVYWSKNALLEVVWTLDDSFPIG